MKGSKVISSGKGVTVRAGGKGKMNTSMLPKPGSGAMAPDWDKSVSPSNNFMKQKPGRSGTDYNKKR